MLAIKELGSGKVEMVVPSYILAEPPVAVVDKNAEAHGAREVAKAYLEYPTRPPAKARGRSTTIGRATRVWSDPAVMKQFPELAVHSERRVRHLEGSARKHFKEGGVFDSIYVPVKTPLQQSASETPPINWPNSFRTRSMSFARTKEVFYPASA